MKAIHLVLLVASVVGMALVGPGCTPREHFSPKYDQKVVGFGAITQGAASSPNGFRVVHVTTLADDGRGSLRAALFRGKRHIVFDVSGTITLQRRLVIADDYITIDGETAGGLGITITAPAGVRAGILIAGTRRHTHDIVMRHIRFRGTSDIIKASKVGFALLSVDGDCRRIRCTPTWVKADGGVSNLAFDHISVLYDRDKVSLWGKVRNVTVSNSLFAGNNKALLVSFYGSRYDLQRTGISIFRNVFIDNPERNPQVRGWTESLDIANNIIVGWTWHGIRLKNNPRERSIDVNIRNNLFQDTNGMPRRALIYLNKNNPASCLPQGEVYTHSGMGKVWVAGNRLPPGNCHQFSTIDTPLAIPPYASLPIQPVSALCPLLHNVGLSSKTQEEMRFLEQARGRLHCL